VLGVLGAPESLVLRRELRWIATRIIFAEIFFTYRDLVFSPTFRMSMPAAASSACSFVIASAKPSKAMLALRQEPPLSGTAISE